MPVDNSSSSPVTHHELSRVMTKPRAVDSSDDLASGLLQGEEREHGDSDQEESRSRSSSGSMRRLVLRLRICFFLFGTINNGMSCSFHLTVVRQMVRDWLYMTVLYVIILSAALDLVPTGTPKVCSQLHNH